MKAGLLIIASKKNSEDSYPHILNPRGSLNNLNDNFHTRTPYEKELNKLTLLISLQRKLEIRKETG